MTEVVLGLLAKFGEWLTGWFVTRGLVAWLIIERDADGVIRCFQAVPPDGVQPVLLTFDGNPFFTQWADHVGAQQVIAGRMADGNVAMVVRTGEDEPKWWFELPVIRDAGIYSYPTLEALVEAGEDWPPCDWPIREFFQRFREVMSLAEQTA